MHKGNWVQLQGVLQEQIRRIWTGANNIGWIRILCLIVNEFICRLFQVVLYVESS
jgi:hypothetical protein